jgi:hypothetical protein
MSAGMHAGLRVKCLLLVSDFSQNRHVPTILNKLANIKLWRFSTFLFVGYFTVLPVTRLYSVEWADKNDLGGIVHGIIEVLSGTRLEGLRKVTKTSVRMASVPAEIRTEHLQNTIVETATP